MSGAGAAQKKSGSSGPKRGGPPPRSRRRSAADRKPPTLGGAFAHRSSLILYSPSIPIRVVAAKNRYIRPGRACEGHLLTPTAGSWIWTPAPVHLGSSPAFACTGRAPARLAAFVRPSSRGSLALEISPPDPRPAPGRSRRGHRHDDGAV